MSGFWRTPEDIIDQIDELFFSSGGRATLCNGNGHLYTGPHRDIGDRILGFKLSNREIALRRAKIDDGLPIDHTIIGRFLNGFNREGVYEYFRLKHRENPALAATETDAVWRHASRLFVESLWGDVKTTICGADKTRIFYSSEIRIAMEDIPWMIHKLMKSTDIDIINETPIGEYRRIYDPLDYESVYRHMCATQQNLMLHEAHRQRSAHAMRIFLYELETYCLDQGGMPAGFDDYGDLAFLETPEERLAWKDRQLRQFMTDQIQRDAAEYSFPPASPLLPLPPVDSKTGRHGRQRLMVAL